MRRVAENGFWQHDALDGNRLLVDETRAHDLEHFGGFRQRQRTRLGRADFAATYRLIATRGYGTLFIGSGQPEETEQRTLLREFRDERAFALTTIDDLVERERIECFANRALADAELRGQCLLAGQRLPGFPFTVGDALDERLVDLAVERAILWGAVHFWWRIAGQSRW